MSSCSIVGCEKTTRARGWCSTHYARNWKYGDPLTIKQNQIHGLTLAERFNAYVVKGVGCWDWTSTKDVHGYGRLMIKAKPVLAHRISWEVNCGPIPEGLHVLHRCDNPSCSNPEHLFLGTHQENVDDKMRKGRHRFGVHHGEAHGRAKLTADDVRQIRSRDDTTAALAREYSVAEATMWAIRNNRTWRHI